MKALSLMDTKNEGVKFNEIRKMKALSLMRTKNEGVMFNEHEK